MDVSTNDPTRYLHMRPITIYRSSTNPEREDGSMMKTGCSVNQKAGHPPAGLTQCLFRSAVLLTATLIFSAGLSRSAEAACPEIEVEVELNGECSWSSWQTIDGLASITTLAEPNTGTWCQRGRNWRWENCDVRVHNDRQRYRSRYCPTSTIATGPAEECEDPGDGDGDGDGGGDTGIANAPLFLTASIEPNIMFVMDDSGSMQWEHMPDQTMRFTTYVFPRPDSIYGGSVYTSQVPSFDDANIHNVFSRSPENNAVFYNPSIEYTPWVDSGNTPYADASPTAAPYNPADLTRGTIDLTSSQTQSAYWFRNIFDNNPDVAYYICGSSYCSHTFRPITFYRYKGSGNRHDTSNYVKYQIRGSNGYSQDLSGGGEVFLNSFVWTDEESGVTVERTVLEERQNFANWFTYYRSRVLAARAGIGRGFAQQDEGMRVGFGAINVGSETIDSVNSDHAIIRGVRPFTGEPREEFFDTLYEHVINTSGTPLRRALDAAGEYYSRDDNRGPWGDTPGEDIDEDHLTCRQSYTILMTDGFWNGSNPGVGNADNSAGPTISNPDGDDYQYTATDPYRDSWSNTLADVAMEYWKKDLRTDLVNRVPTHPRNNAFWQHMVTFGVGLGVTGTVDPDDAWNAVETGSAISWPNPDNSNPGKLDDLLHAGVNGHGGFFTAADPDTFAAELSDVLDAIVARVDTSANSAASSSAVLQSDTLLYTAGFRSGDWSGTLSARKINSDGTLEPENCDGCWNAETLLAARSPADRDIFTVNADTEAGVSLAWDNLHSSQKAALNRDPANNLDNLGSARVAWLRGTEHGSLRSRSEVGPLRLLGDFIYSDPQFKNSVLYIGGNDGMLHAFDANDGTELFAYIPSELLVPEPGRNHAPLSRLMDPAYDHRFFMDGTVTLADVTIGGDPKTYLVGGMGVGGRTVYALDVTDLGDVENPQDFAAGDIKWEFTHPELGYRASTPAVVRMKDGTWAAVFGNGYNSASGKASLFIVNLETGELIERIETNDQTANGLAGPFITDWPERDLRANRIYAGDLKGNLWVFDVSSANSNQWTNANNRRVLFSAEDEDGDAQPITSRPFGARFDSDHAIITFGTGSYFRNLDKDSDQIQSLYGVMDAANPGNNPDTIERDDLLQQEIIDEVAPAPGEIGAGLVLRFISDYELDLDAEDPDDRHKGWFLDFDTEPGERVINSPRAFGQSEQRVRFTTLIPDEDPCGSGRRGFLMDINVLSGARLETPVFDLNGDFEFTDADKITVNGAQLPPSGIRFGTGESPVVIDVRLSGASGGGDYQLICDGEGNCEVGRPSDITVGRQSWIQAR